MNRFFIKGLVLFLFMFSIVVVSCGTFSSSVKEESDPDQVKTIDIEGEGRYYYKVNENRDGIIITEFAHAIGLPCRGLKQKKREVRRSTVVIPPIIDGLPVVELGAGAFQGYCLEHSPFSGDVYGIIYESNKPSSYEVPIDFINIPPTVTKIARECFKGSTVQRIVLPESLKIIGYEVFAETEELQEIILPESLETIGARAFVGSNLRSIKLPKNLKRIEEDAFKDCDFLSEESKTALVDFGVILPTTDPNPASDFKYELNYQRTGVVIKKYTGKRKKVIIPATIEGFPVVELASGSFSATVRYPFGSRSEDVPIEELNPDTFDGSIDSDIVSVVIPDSVVKMGGFFFCNLLEKVILPKGLKIISESCFVGCSSLKEITLTEGLEEIERGAFSSSSLESIVIPDRVKKLNGFYHCKNLKTVAIGRGVQEIGSSAFGECTALTTVIGGDNVGKIGTKAFENCTSLTNISIGKKLQVVGNSAFEGCASLTTFTMDNNLKKDMGSEAFKGCKKLTTVTIGDNLISIGGSAFAGCKALTTVTIGDNLKSINDFAFQYCTSLTTVTIGKGLEEIGLSAFEDCRSLTTFNIDTRKPVRYHYDYGLDDHGYPFKGCSSLSLREKKKIMETGYKGEF